MKKFSLLVLSLLMILSLFACSEDAEISSPEEKDRKSESAQSPDENEKPSVDEWSGGQGKEEQPDQDSPVVQKPTTKNVNVPKLEKKPLSINAATIKTYQGEIKSEKQTDTYSYTPERDGRYAFSFSEVKSGVRLSVYIYDHLDERVTYSDYIENGDYLHCNLKTGETYKITVRQSQGFSGYILSLGEQAPTADITDYSQVTDSLVFPKQQNVYSFTVERDGRYTFSFSEIKSGVEFHFYLYDHLGETVVYSDYIKNNEVKHCNLLASESYTVEITQKKDFGAYVMNIGKQKETLKLSSDYIVKDALEFYKQQNVYTLKAPEQKTYTVKFTQMSENVEMQVYVYNYLDEVVVKDDYCKNNDTLELKDLDPAKDYRIVITQKDGFGDYTMTVSK